jgi:hypothetical protein
VGAEGSFPFLQELLTGPGREVAPQNQTDLADQQKRPEMTNACYEGNYSSSDSGIYSYIYRWEGE